MKILKNHRLILAIQIGLIVACTNALCAQQNGHVAISAQDLQSEAPPGEYKGFPLYQNWRYHPGDDPAWADPKFDDSDWEIAPDTRLFPGTMPKSGWPGIGWFRLRLNVAPALAGSALALCMYCPGASEIYLDGQLIYRFGRIGDAREDPHWDNTPKVLYLGDRAQHLLAVRYSGHAIKPVQELGFPIGFGLVVGDLNRSIADKSARIRKSTFYQMFFSGVPMAVALVHLFLFAFYPRTRTNLYFSLFAASFAAYVYLNFKGHYLTDATLHLGIVDLGRISEEIASLSRIWRPIIVLMTLSGMRFLYALFYDRLPRQFYALLIAGLALGLWSWFMPKESWRYLNLYVLCLIVEMIRVVILAIAQKKYGARIIGVGTASMFFGAIYLIFRNLGIEGIPFLSHSFYFGFLVLFFSMSVQLARDFATTRRGLERQLEAVQALSQTNVELRQSRALEQVRAEATAMRQSKDILNVVAALWHGLESCGLEFEAIGIAVTEPGRRRLQFYAAAEVYGDMVSLLPDPNRRLIATDVIAGVNLWRNDMPLSHALTLRPRPGLHLVDAPFYAYLQKIWDIRDPEQKLKDRPIIEVAFHHGYMGLLARRDRAFTEDHCRAVERFVEALSLGYTRYFDLQQLEVQNRELEEANRQVHRANLAKSAFLANMSHEIRTPINAILGYAQILQRSEDLPAAYRPAITTIQRSGDHLLNLISDVLEFSKIEADRLELTPTDFDLTQMLQSMGSMFGVRCAQKDIAWQLDGTASDALWVRGDEAKLTQVLINLLDNAVKFTETGSITLKVTDQTRDLRPETGEEKEEGRLFLFEVTDTGPGISKEDQKQLFETFQQGTAGADHGGTGLGLAIARRHVELMGGTLKVASTLGEGTRFSFAIPFQKGRESAGDSEPWARVRHLAPEHHVKALVADDIAESRAVLTHALEEIGVAVHAVQNGREALTHLKTSTPDIAFLDVRMPELDGLETLKQMQNQAEWRAIKTVAVSASSFDVERKRVLAAGFDSFIAKPYRFEAVYACLNDLLGVTYTYADADAPASEPDTDAWKDIVLPSDLLNQLCEAAEFRRVTRLEACLKELSTLDTGADQLAAHLRDLRRRHDMDGILDILRGLQHG